MKTASLLEYTNVKKNRKEAHSLVNAFSYYDSRGQEIYRLLSQIDLESVSLYDTIQNNVFTDIDFYSIISNAPMWIRNAGNSEESCLDKIAFEQKCLQNNNYLTNKLLYFHDFEMLMGAFQNRYSILENLLNKLYNIITPNLSCELQEYDDCGFSRDTESIEAHSFLNSIYINLNSGFDILTKIVYELKYIDSVAYDKYPKLKSSKILFGDRNKLDSQFKIDTIFSYPPIVREIEAIRDEIIHNGSLDFNNVIYQGLLGGEIYKWIFYPDFNEDGTFVSSKNRRKFYSNLANTFNNRLPDLMIEVLELILNTLIKTRITYHKPYFKSSNDIIKFKNEIKQWYDLS